MNRKIMFFDIDGTLITDDGRRYFPESAKMAIKQARKNGHLVFINTGRVKINVDDFLKEVGFDGYVCGCGTYIEYDGKVLLHHKLDKGLCQKIAMVARDCQVFGLYEASDRTTIDGSLTPAAQEVIELIDYFEKMKRLYRKIEDDFYFDKFAAWYEAESDLETFKHAIKDEFQYIHRGEGFCELVPHGFSKATGIAFLLEHFHLTIEDCYAFGDSNNDLPMLSFVKHSIAMGGSNETLCSQCEFVTKTVEDDGILYAMKHYGLVD